MGALTAEQPKCLTEFVGKPLLHHQKASMSEAGIEQIGIVTGYKRELLQSSSITEFHNARWAETNMVASLMCASGWLKQFTCIVSYSDIFYSPATVSALLDCEAPLAISYDPHWRAIWQARFEDPLSDAETFCLDGDNKYVINIGARAQSLDEIQGQYMGLIRIAPDGWAQVEAYLNQLSSSEIDRLDMTGLLSALIAQGRKIGAVPQVGGWGEIDSAEDLSVYEQFHREKPYSWIDGAGNHAQDGMDQ